MKFNCDRLREIAQSRHIYLTNWHPWFAWRPVRIGEGDCRWLEWVERKGSYWSGCGESSWTFFYRTPA